MPSTPRSGPQQRQRARHRSEPAVRTRPQRASGGSVLQAVRELRVLFEVVPWRMRTRIVLMLLAALCSALLDLAAVGMMLPLTQLLMSADGLPPVVERWIVPVAGTRDPQRLLLIVASVVAVAFLIKNVSVIAIRWWSVGEAKRASAAVQGQMLRAYMGSSWARHRLRSKSSMLNMLTAGVPAAFDMVLTSMLAVIVDSVAVALIAALLFAVSPLAALLAVLIFGGFALLISRVFKPYSLRYAHRNFELGKDAYAYLNPAIEGFRETRLFRREALFADAYEANRREAAGLTRFQTVVAEMPRYLLEVVMVMGILAVAVVLFATQDSATAFGLLAVFAAAALRVVPALNRAVTSMAQMRNGMPSLTAVSRELTDLLAERTGDPARDEQIVDIPAAAIRADGVSFRYADAERDTLHDVSAVIEPGTTVALVGGSGAGKTTFADLLAGLFQPTAGSLTVGDVDLSEHPRSWLANVAVVSQKVYLWDASIRDLITFGQPRAEVDDALLADVVRRARLEELVAEMPEGLDTFVGDSGTRLSGGQTQRLGIARALYAQPEVLIMDEATSALDNETEHRITRTIAELHGRMTVIVIAHRLSTVKDADNILFFSQGRLRAQGTMGQLVRTDREFARLVQLGQLSADPDQEA